MAAKLHWWEWDRIADDGVRIIDPDGFRQSEEEYNDLYTWDEFLYRRQQCTLSFKRKHLDIESNVPAK